MEHFSTNYLRNSIFCCIFAAELMKKMFIIVFLALSLVLDAQEIVHLDGRFRQVRESSMLSDVQVLTGRFVFDAPDRVSWTYDNGIKTTLPEPFLRFIGGTVNGTYLEENEDFAVSRTDKSLTLVPKKKRLQKLFSKIEITLDQRGIAEQVVMTEPTGDKTTITFDFQ